MRIVKIGAVWCPACLVMRNTWKLLKNNYSLDIEELDCDMNPEEVEKYNIGDKLPVIIFFDNDGNELSRLIGEKNYSELEDKIKEYINKGV